MSMQSFGFWAPQRSCCQRRNWCETRGTHCSADFPIFPVIQSRLTLAAAIYLSPLFLWCGFLCLNTWVVIIYEKQKEENKNSAELWTTDAAFLAGGVSGSELVFGSMHCVLQETLSAAVLHGAAAISGGHSQLLSRGQPFLPWGGLFWGVFFREKTICSFSIKINRRFQSFEDNRCTSAQVNWRQVQELVWPHSVTLTPTDTESTE